jgi:hypothetical protein
MARDSFLPPKSAFTYFVVVVVVVVVVVSDRKTEAERVLTQRGARLQ